MTREEIEQEELEEKFFGAVHDALMAYVYFRCEEAVAEDAYQRVIDLLVNLTEKDPVRLADIFKSTVDMANNPTPSMLADEQKWADRRAGR